MSCTTESCFLYFIHFAHNLGHDDHRYSHTGEEGSTIWLSILGEVYDVSTGTDYYAKDGPYAVFTGRDASTCFATGDFTEEGGAKSATNLSLLELPDVVGWQAFYREHETYKFVGFLEEGS